MSSLHPVIAELLDKRGITGTERESFLHPDFSRDTHPGSLMKGMSVAVDRLGTAIKNKERIVIFGDYDADGVPATALLVRAFQGLGVEVKALIPTRASGYGLNEDVVAAIIAYRADVLVTVDNGTVSSPEITALKKAGIDTIVCDHHEPQEGHVAEDALSILNPKQADCSYPFKELCGCAIAWKLATELYGAQGKDVSRLRWMLDLVAFSTIADMVPLVGENRVLTVYGLKVLRKTRNFGLQALAAVAGIKLADISSGSVGFHMAPRINAPSRMHQEVEDGEHVALRLLVTEDETEAFRLAEYLNRQNQDRQGLVDVHIREAEVLAALTPDDRCLVLYKETWSTGVIGLVAGRMVEKYQRPVIALAMEGDQIKGSVRSVDGVHAVSLLEAAGEHLEKYGGHSKAAGLTLKSATGVADFRTSLNKWLEEEKWEIEALKNAARRDADLELPLTSVDMELAEALLKLEPYGIGFPNPMFTSRCRLENIRKVGKEGKHVACVLVDGSSRCKAIGFRMGEKAVAEGEEYDVTYTVDKEEWNGRESVGCKIREIRPA